MGKVLLVDDEEDFLEVLGASLTENGFNIISATSGFDALTLLKEDSDISCILADYYMPKMRGEELAMMIRHELEIPVIIMTSDPSIQFDRIYRSGISGVLSKPIDAESFTEFLKQNDLHLDDTIKHRKFLRNMSHSQDLSLKITNGRETKDAVLDNLSTQGMGIIVDDDLMALSTIQFILSHNDQEVKGFMHCRWKAMHEEKVKAGFEFDSITKKNLSKNETFYSWIKKSTGLR